MVCGGPGGCCFLGALVLAACAVGVFSAVTQLLDLAVETCEPAPDCGLRSIHVSVPYMSVIVS